MSGLSRRKLITTGLAATAGASGLAAAARLAARYGLIPPDYGGIYGPGTTLTFASQRLLTRHSLAREFPRSQISKNPFPKLRPFKAEPFDSLRAGGFVDFRLSVEGMVARPASFSLPELRSFPARTQITQLVCEEGWSFVAEWMGAPLSTVLNAVETLPQARYLVYYSLQPRWWQTIDMADALHPQTLLVYGMNGEELPMGHGGPLRLQVARQLGYKSVKFIHRFIVTDSLKQFNKGGSYSWYAGI
jgi:DMSO/TMAO reductase YedYZ molybdopterin-dependent catalytic subunit